ncbi:Uncharacterised protein [Mycobacteroides abscessus subsp. abscessus]|nr:Uncharacterised protein [Mycobacteroides abscessus subsp. abscessus]
MYVKHNAKDPVVNVKVTDNFDELRISLNGSELFYNEFKEPYAMRNIEKVLKKVKLELKDGLQAIKQRKQLICISCKKAKRSLIKEKHLIKEQLQSLIRAIL